MRANRAPKTREKHKLLKLEKLAGGWFPYAWHCACGASSKVYVTMDVKRHTNPYHLQNVSREWALRAWANHLRREIEKSGEA